MIVQYLDFLAGELMVGILELFGSLMIANGVSILGLVVAVSLLCIVIGSVLMRVS